MKKRLIVLWLVPLLMLLTGSLNVSAASEEETDRLFQEQTEMIGGDRLFQESPEEVKEALSRSGITGLEPQKLQGLSVGQVLSEIVSMTVKNSKTPLCGLAACLGVLLLCSVTEGFRIGASGMRLGTVQNAVGTICIASSVIVPFSQTITSASGIISGGAGFMLLYIPIMAGLFVSAGSVGAGGAYYTAMMTAGNAVSAAASKLIVPLMNVFLALSVSSSLSPKLQLGTLCESIYKIGKWALTLLMSVFVTVMSVNTLVSSSLDHVSKRALKFTVSSFVPVVGGLLSEALNTFNGSLELLKTGAGVFIIIAAAFLMLPVLLECVVWQFSLFLLTSCADICGIGQMSGLFKAVSKAVGMLIALLLCVLTVFIISSVMILLIAKE